jgi:hypothetical protein
LLRIDLSAVELQEPEDEFPQLRRNDFVDARATSIALRS